MKSNRLWQGVRMRQVAASADPDRPARMVTLPATWDHRAADALAALVSGDGPISLAGAANSWLSLIAQKARQAGQSDDIAGKLQRLLRQRQASPNAAIWRGEDSTPGFILNAAGFHDATHGYDVAGFGEAAELAARACHLLAPSAERIEIGFAGLDDLLACLGLAYDSRAARSLAACLAALMRARAEHALEGDQRDLLAMPASWPTPPRACAIAGLAEAAAAARKNLSRAPGSIPATGIFLAGPAEALLGIETGGIAPAFSPVRETHLTRAAQDRLAAAAMSPEAALADILQGGTPLPIAGLEAHAAMQEAVAAYVDTTPPLPTALPTPQSSGATPPRLRVQPEKLPARRAGLMQKASLGGHRVILRSGEYADGRLGELELILPRESDAVRGLAECFAQAVSIGLQHGVKLEDFVDAFALTRFGPAGNVDGDPDVQRATSVIDYAMRSLSVNYLGRSLPEPETEDYIPQPDREGPPMLPLDLPRARRRALRLIA